MAGRLLLRSTTLLLMSAAALVSQCACTSRNSEIGAKGNASSSSQPPRYDGYIDEADCETIRGWAWDQNQPDAPVRIEVYGDGQLLAVISADQLRENLIGAGKGNGRHAYAYVIRPSLKDGKPHSLRLKIEGSSFELGNSPKSINCIFQSEEKR